MHLHERKGIVAIALQAGVPIVPVFVYGHTSLYTVVVDPFGILKFLSCRLNLALTPFLGLIPPPPFAPPLSVSLLFFPTSHSLPPSLTHSLARSRLPFLAPSLSLSSIFFLPSPLAHLFSHGLNHHKQVDGAGHLDLLRGTRSW